MSRQKREKTMTRSFFSGVFSIMSVLLLVCLCWATPVFAKDLSCSMAKLPNISESPEKGVFVDLVKALDEAYGGGKFTIHVYPFSRSIDNVVQGKADFHIPLIKNPYVGEKDLPYRYVSEKVGEVVFVIYSRKDSPITLDDIKKGKTLGKFPYVMETYRGMENFFDFPVKGSSGIDMSFNKLLKKRVDACLFAQEEADFILTQFKLTGVHRAPYGMFDDILIIEKGPAGDEADKILSKAIHTLRADGRLQKLHLKIHKPYQEWQP